MSTPEFTTKIGATEATSCPSGTSRGTSSFILHLALERPKLDGEYEYHLYLVCVRLEEDELGRQLTASELDRFTRSFYAPSYRRDLETIPKELWDQLNSELEEEAPSARRKRPPRRRAG